MVRIISFFLIIVSISFAQDISLKVSTDSVNYKIGDFIKYKVEADYPNNVEIFFPSIKDSLIKLELISTDTIITSENNNRKKSIFNFTLAGYDSGNFVIPSYSIFYKEKTDTLLKSIKTDSVLITVHTLKVDTEIEIKDIKDPIKIPLDWKLVLMWIFIGSVVILAGYLIYKKIKSRKKQEISPEKILFPYELALISLKALEEKQLWQKGLIKEYHTEITEIIRKYFEDRFLLPALELTTYEVLSRLENLSECNSIYNLTRDFLNNADLVKFAKFIPMNNINEEMLKQAYKIIELTIPKPAIEEQKVVEDTNV